MGHAQSNVLFGFEFGGSPGGLFVIDLDAVDPAIGRSVILVADQPVHEAEEGGHFADPEAQGGGDRGDAQAEQASQGKHLGRFADSDTTHGGPDHRGEDLDR